MTNYGKGFGVSFILHAAVLALVLWFTPGGAERDLVVVDFSNIALGGPQEGGARRGSGPEPEEPPAKAEAAPESGSETALEPAPEPAPEPEPVPAPEPVLSEQAVPVKETPQKQKPEPRPRPAPAKPAPQPARQREATREAAREAAAERAGAAPGAPTGSGGTPEGRGSGPGTGTGHEEGRAQGYVRENFNYILVRIQRNLDYPSQARRMNLSGSSKFSFIINLDGSIAELRLEESSGHHILDDAARKAIQRAAPFPAPPVPARLIIPIKFSLRG